MGIFDWFKRAPKAASKATAEEGLAGLFVGMKSPPQRGSAELLTIAEGNPRMLANVLRIATSVASTPYELGQFIEMRDVAGAKVRMPQRVMKHWLRMKGTDQRRAIKAAEDTDNWKEIEQHPLLDLLNDGSAIMDGFNLRMLTCAYLDLVGDAYWALELGTGGVPTAAYVLPPTWLQDAPKGSNGLWRFHLPGGSMLALEADRVLAFRVPSFSNPYGHGLGLGASLVDELDSDEYAAQLVKAAFYNRGEPSGFISMEGADDPTILATKVAWDEGHRGPRKYGRLKFINRKMDYTKIAQNFEELKLLELRGFNRDLLIQTFGLPPEMAGVLTNSNRATITAAAYIMAAYVELQRLERVQRLVQQQLVPRYNDSSLILTFVSPVQEDLDRQATARQIAPYHMTRNEWRAQQGLGPVPESQNVYLVPLGLIAERATPKASPAEPVAEEPGVELDLGEPKATEGCDCGGECGKHMGLGTTKASEDERIEQVVDAIRPELIGSQSAAVHHEYMAEWGQGILDELGTDLEFNLLNPAVVQFLDEASTLRIKDLIDSVTRDRLREALMAGTREGEGARDLTRRVRDVFDSDPTRAERIARTEVGRAANFGTYQAQLQSGVVEERQWVAAFVKTRPEHVKLNGDVVGMDEPFVYAGVEAMYPQDFGVPELDINCMCTTVSVVQEPKALADLEPIWKGYIRQRLPWVRAAREAFQRGLDAQQAAAVAAVKQAFND